MLIDSHSHLDMKDFDKDRDQVIERAKKAGIAHMLTIGIDLPSSRKALRLAEARDFIFSSLGFHPHNADVASRDSLKKLCKLASRIPLDRLRLETDAPFLTPVPERGRRNEPLFVFHTPKKIAALRNTDFDEVGLMTAENAKDLFNLPDKP